MPVKYINSYISNAVGTPGDTTVTMGTDNNGDQGLINYSYNYSVGAYYIPASYLGAIPNNAIINKIAFQYIMASNKTYSVPEITSFMYVHPPDVSPAAFPFALRNTGYAVTNNIYNAAIENYTAVLPETSSYSFTSPSVVNPAGEYIDLPLVNSLTYIAGYDIAMTFINNSNSSTGTKNGKTPFVASVDLGWVGAIGNSAGFYYEQEEDATGSVGGTTTPYPIGAITVRRSSPGFKPNVKIYWNEAT